MPIKELIPLAISGANAVSQMVTNNANRKFALEMYQMQRRDAINDRDTANQYNSPKEQMQRLREAGLNPNLVYGSGAGQIQNVPVAPPATQQYQGRAPQADPYLTLETMKANAQTDLTRQNLEVMKEEVNLKRAQTYATLTAEQRAAFDLQLEIDRNYIVKEGGYKIALPRIYRKQLDEQFVEKQTQHIIKTQQKEEKEQIEKLGYDEYFKQLENTKKYQHYKKEIQKRNYKH